MTIKLLDRYLTKELSTSFLFGVIAFSAILAGSTILIPLMREATHYGASFEQIIKLFIYQMPGVIVFTFPMAMLLASIVVFSRMNNDLEIIAFRSVGVSFFRLLQTVILCGLFVSLMTIWFNESIVPQATKSARDLVEVIEDDDQPVIKQNINITEYDDQQRPLRVINIQEVEGRKLKGITMLDYEEGELKRAVKAENGRWLKSGGWEFYDGSMHNFSMTNRKRALYIEFKKEQITMDINPVDLKNRKKSFEELTAKELKKRINLKQKTGEQYKDDLVRYHLKFAVPFSSLIFALLGATVGLRPQRSTQATGMGFSLVIILCYYALLGVSLGLSHVVAPVLAAWMPNLVVGIAGILKLKKVAKQ